MACKVALQHAENKKGVAMEHATGLRVKTGLLWEALKVDSKKRFTAQTWQTITEDVWNDVSKQMRVGLLFCNRHTFSVFDLLCFCYRFDCWLVLPRLRVPLTCTGVFSGVTHRVVCEEPRSWLQRCVDWLGLWIPPKSVTHTRTKQGVKLCQRAKSCVSGRTRHPSSQWQHPQFPVGTSPDLATASTCVRRLSCSSALCPVLLCFLLLYEAGSSNSGPQEAIHFLIIFTSNRGRRRDADHKFSPPPVRCGAIAQQQLPLIGAVGSNC